MDFCHRQIAAKGKLDENTQNILKQWGSGGKISVKDRSLRAEIAAIFSAAIIDAYSPCSLFCLLLFFAVLWLYSANNKKCFLVGCSFIISLGAIHLFQQVYAELFFALFSYARIFAIVSGILLLFAAWRKWKNYSQESLVIVFLVTLLTVAVVYSYQQTCGLNMSIVFEQWINSIHLSLLGKIIYTALYMLFYLLTLSVILIFYLTYNFRQHIFYYSACLLLTFIGIVLIVAPSLLSNFILSCVVIVGALISGWQLKINLDKNDIE